MSTMCVTFGSTWRAMMRQGETPNALAAVTKSIAATFIVSARKSLASAAHPVTPMMTARRKSRTSARSSPVS
ncbi:unknown [Sutterella sp. CAG:397]|nr:unknown [Sutterella sp. CAG:397]